MENTKKKSRNSNFYTSPYNSSDSEEFYYLPSSPPPTHEEQLRIKAEKNKYLENKAEFPLSKEVEKYLIKGKVGQGTFGEVFRGTLRDDDTKEVALKRILMPKISSGFPMTSLREIRILKLLNHNNIIKLIEVVHTKACEKNNYLSAFYMVFEFCDHDLAGVLSNQHLKISLSEIKGMMHQLFLGVFFMHYNKILHRDIKSANVLINRDGILKIADFGLARAYSEPLNDDTPNTYTNCVVTIWYRPPELLLGDCNYGPPIDIWGVGCIMAEMWNRAPIFQGDSEQKQLNLISQLCGSITPNVWPNVVSMKLFNSIELDPGQKRKVIDMLKPLVLDHLGLDLLDKLLVLDPEKRLNADQALNHPFFWTDPLPCSLDRLMCSLTSNHLEFLIKMRRKWKPQRNYLNSFSSTKISTLSTANFTDHIF